MTVSSIPRYRTPIIRKSVAIATDDSDAALARCAGPVRAAVSWPGFRARDPHRSAGADPVSRHCHASHVSPRIVVSSFVECADLESYL